MPNSDRSRSLTTRTLALPAEVAQRAQRLIEAGTATNTRRAYQGDLRYFWTWADVAVGLREPSYPVAVALVVQFITDHVTGLPESLDHALVASRIKAHPGPQQLTTIRRRIASLSTVHAALGVENPCRDPRVRQLLSKAGRAAVAAGRRPRQKRAATRDVLDSMLATCGDDLIDLRDRAVLLVGAASGGRRRSELAAMTVENLTPVPGGFLVRLVRTKTDQEGRGLNVPVLGRAGEALQTWLGAAAITTGPLFRGVGKGGRVAGCLSDRAVARIVQKRAQMAGFDASAFGAHSLRAGFITESGRQRVPLGEAKALSGHRSDAVALGYYRSGSVIDSPAARLFG